MNKKQITSLSCFASSKNENKYDVENNFNCINSNKKPISKSVHDNMNYLDSSSLHSSNSSGQNILTLRPKPPPYDEYTAKKYGITRSHSTYSACNSSSFCQNFNGDKIEQLYTQEDTLSQYSDSDPPRLTDHLSKLSISRHCVRPVTLRPVSPVNKRSYRPVMSFTKTVVDTQQSPSGDSGVRLTPNEMEQSIRSREAELYNYLHLTSDNDQLDELKLLKLVNNKLSLNELNNQHLITKATHLIGKLRQKLKEKDFEIINLQTKLKDNTEKLRLREISCKELEIQYQQACRGINGQPAIAKVTDAFTQTAVPSDQDNCSIYLQSLNVRFDDERAKWLEEKALVISYHKQLNEKYQNLMLKNTQLENELVQLQGRYISDVDYPSDTCVDSDIGDKKQGVLQTDTNLSSSSSINNNGSQSVSRLVKFEESLC